MWSEIQIGFLLLDINNKLVTGNVSHRQNEQLRDAIYVIGETFRYLQYIVLHQ